MLATMLSVPYSVLILHNATYFSKREGSQNGNTNFRTQSFALVPVDALESRYHRDRDQSYSLGVVAGSKLLKRQTSNFIGDEGR